MQELSMQLFTSFISALSLFFILGCTQSSIKMPERNVLLISNDQTQIRVHTSIAEKRQKNLYPVYVEQKIVGVDARHCVVYEDIRLANGYRFNYAYRHSIDLIFNAYSVEPIKRFGDLTLYRVKLRDKDKSLINVLAQTSSKRSLKLLYGLDESEVQLLLKDLDQNSIKVDYTLVTTSKARDHCIQTSWQPKLLILDGLLRKEGGKVRGGF